MLLTENFISKTKSLQTPCLIMDPTIIKDNYQKAKSLINNSRIFYAIKANCHPKVIDIMVKEGASFDIASKNELDMVLKMGAKPEDISYGNTIKKTSDIEYVFNKGVRLFVADEFSEIDKIAKVAPGSKVYIRLQMSDSDSDWPLTKKFGTNMDRAKVMLKHAKSIGLIPYGVSFHVGSQCYDKYVWKATLLKVKDIFNSLRADGIELSFINTGGGIPIQHLKPIPSINEISEVINSTVDELFNEYENLIIGCEPGRSMVGDAGILISEVILKAERERNSWLYIDIGVYTGLMETIQDFRYEIIAPTGEGEDHLFTLSGPTCDSVDTLYDEIFLPESLDEGDKLYFLNAGAYTTSYASNFNGFNLPKTYFINTDGSLDF